jgi:hypothetical protein
MADGTLKVGQITNSAGSGNITIGSGVTVNVNRPAFEAYQSVVQTPTLSTYVKLTLTSENFDTDSAYDATNSKFTVPSGAAGKYVFLLDAGGYDDNVGLNVFRLVIYKNGAIARFSNILDTDTTSIQTAFATCTGVLDLAVSDYIEAYIWVSSDGGTYTTLAGSTIQTRFSGYKLGA